MSDVNVLGAKPGATGIYKVDERVGRVSSEWFSRPADERFLSLSDLFASVNGRAERSRTRTVESAAVRVEASRDDAERLTPVRLGSEAPVAPTHWGFGQLASLVGARASGPVPSCSGKPVARRSKKASRTRRRTAVSPACSRRGYSVFNPAQVDGSEVPALPMLPAAERIGHSVAFFAASGAEIRMVAAAPATCPASTRSGCGLPAGACGAGSARRPMPRRSLLPSLERRSYALTRADA